MFCKMIFLLRVEQNYYFSNNLKEHDNRATAGVAADSTFQFAILPVAKLLIERLGKDAVRFYYPGYELSFSDTEPRNQKEVAETSNILYKSGLITKNEARLSCGWSSLGPSGELFFGNPALASEKNNVEKVNSQQSQAISTSTEEKHLAQNKTKIRDKKKLCKAVQLFIPFEKL